MNQTPIFEQVSAGKPGRPFVASGLFRLAGYVVAGRFVRPDRPQPLRTMREWQDVPEPPLWRCPNCLGPVAETVSGSGVAAPCRRCHHGDVAPQGMPQGMAQVTFAAPDTLGRVARLHREGRITEESPPPVEVLLVPPAPPRTTQAAPVDMLGQVVALQTHRQWRPAQAPRLHTMAGQPCARCGGMSCACPPSPPRVLEAAVERRALAVERQEQSYEDAGVPPLRRV